MQLPCLVIFLACATAIPAAEPPRVGTPASLPRYAFKPQVEDYYPAASRRLMEQGTTTIKLCHDDQGKSVEAMVVGSSGYWRLDQAAVRWARAVRISPGTIKQGCVVAPVRFRLDNSGEPKDQDDVPLIQVPRDNVSVQQPERPPVRLIPLGA